MSARAAALALLVLACCGGGAPHLPVLSSLEINPSTAQRGDPIALTAEVRDDDGDLAPGRAEVAYRALSEAHGAQISAALAGAAGETKQAKLSVTLLLPEAIPGAYEVALTAIDAAGLRSAPLTGNFELTP